VAQIENADGADMMIDDDTLKQLLQINAYAASLYASYALSRQSGT
jgi:hypothetical protein